MPWVGLRKQSSFQQMLDGQEKTLDVSQIDSRPSPSKQQKTLDGYLKRCNNSTERQPHTKHPRFWGTTDQGIILASGGARNLLDRGQDTQISNLDKKNC
jgi:hypothetical protein